MEAAWYVLQTKPNQESWVSQRLLQQEIETFLPRMRARVRAGRHVQDRIVPMFPAYLFVRADLERQGKRLRFTPGVRSFLSFGDAPAIVAPEIVARLREKVGDGGVWIPPARPFRPGERLRIEDGPLSGLEVIFERELSAAGRVAVLLAEIQLGARVVLPRQFLTAVS